MPFLPTKRIKGTASKKYRLYDDNGKVLGTFDKLHLAKRREQEYEAWLKTQHGNRKAKKTNS